MDEILRGDDQPHHHNAPPGTSEVAADAIAGIAPTLERLVMDHIRSCGPAGCTDEEGQDALGMDSNTYRPRRWTLAKNRAVTLSVLRRPTRSGRQAAVWVAGEFA